MVLWVLATRLSGTLTSSGALGFMLVVKIASNSIGFDVPDIADRGLGPLSWADCGPSRDADCVEHAWGCDDGLARAAAHRRRAALRRSSPHGRGQPGLGPIENPNTRAAYFHACRRFFGWCDAKGLDELVAIEPMHVTAYIRALGKDFEKPTVKQHLAAIRMLFDWLVVGQVIAINPAHAVRGPKHVVKRGKTPVLMPDEARKLLDSIDVTTLAGMCPHLPIGSLESGSVRP
jgi:hypothetical protein